MCIQILLILSGLLRLRILGAQAQGIEGPSAVPFKVYNIGCSHPVKLMDFIGEIENALGVEAKKEFLPMQQGDVYQTFADCSNLESELGYHPSTTLHEGIGRFIEWFKSVYTLKENQDV